MMNKRIGVIGVGIMGSGMAQRLLEQGFQVVACDRDAEKVARLVALGATGAASPAETASQAGTVILMLRDDATVRTVLFGPAGALAAARPGTTFINSSTVTPGLVEEIAAAIEAKGCAFLDAEVTGSKAGAAVGKIGFLVCGRPEVIEAQRGLLNILGQSITVFGRLGQSATFKLANNQLAAVLVRAIGESLALCEAAGIDRQTAVDALTATAPRVCGLKKEKLLNRDWSCDFSLEFMLKDLDATLRTAAELGVSMPLLATAQEIYRRAVESGAGALDCSVVAGAK